MSLRPRLGSFDLSKDDEPLGYPLYGTPQEGPLLFHVRGQDLAVRFAFDEHSGPHTGLLRPSQSDFDVTTCRLVRPHP